MEKHGRLRMTQPSIHFHNYRGNNAVEWKKSDHLYDTECWYQGFVDKDGFPDGPGVCLLTGLKKMHIGHFKSGWWHGEFLTFYDNGDKWRSNHVDGALEGEIEKESAIEEALKAKYKGGMKMMAKHY